MTKPAMNQSVYFTTREAGVALGVCLRSVQLWCSAGVLPASTTMGGHRRIHRAHLELLKAHQTEGRANPTAAEYQRAVARWAANTAGLLRRMSADDLVSQISMDTTDEAWMLTQHQTERAMNGDGTFDVDNNGALLRVRDAAAHDHWCAGYRAAMTRVLAMAGSTTCKT